MNEKINPDFEKAGLIIEGNRVLTYSKMVCPLDCKYCFVDVLNNEQKRTFVYLSKEQFELLKKLPNEIRSIMLGCDTEFLQNRKEVIQLLDKLITLKKNISIITKLSLTKKFISELKLIQDKLNVQGNIMTFSISISCFKSSNFWEPKAPSPENRIKTLREAYSQGLKCMVAIRPLIPNISESEINEIIEKTSPYVFGYYSGPLYLKNLNSGLFTEGDISKSEISIEEIQPDWMPIGNKFLKIENKHLMGFLRRRIIEKGKPLFEGAADGIDFLIEEKND